MRRAALRKASDQSRCFLLLPGLLGCLGTITAHHSGLSTVKYCEPPEPPERIRRKTWSTSETPQVDLFCRDGRIQVQSRSIPSRRLAESQLRSTRTRRSQKIDLYALGGRNRKDTAGAPGWKSSPRQRNHPITARQPWGRGGDVRPSVVSIAMTPPPKLVQARVQLGVNQAPD